MMFTVSEALRLPILERAEVVAGASGLRRPIRWVHNVSQPNAADWLHGGEMLLTTIANLPATPGEQCAFLRQCAAKRVVAVLITTGKLLDAIPDYLRQVGDELGLPLIELSYKTRFVDIAKVINERIAEKDLYRLNRALSIQRRLSRLVLDGGGLPELANTLAEQVGLSISIETERFEAIANANLTEVDAARRYTMQHGRTDPRLIAALEQDYLPRIRASLQPLQLPKMPDLGLELERLLAPIVVHGDIYGYMWIIADLRALTPVDMMAIEIGATVAALLMLHEETLQAAAARRRGSLVAQLIEGPAQEHTLAQDQALRLGLDLQQPWRMLLLSYGEGTVANGPLYRSVNVALSRWSGQAVAAPFAGRVVILAQAGAGTVESLAQAVLQGLRDSCDKAQIAISTTFSLPQAVSIAHQQCLDSVIIAERIAWRSAVLRYEDLGYLHTLYQAGPASLAHNRQVPVLEKLRAPGQPKLLRTLEAYLDSGGNAVQAAHTLCIHRSTLNYRLARIREICSLELSDAATRTNLQVTIKMMRLFAPGDPD